MTDGEDVVLAGSDGAVGGQSHAAVAIAPLQMTTTSADFMTLTFAAP
jgi:hypothetical protein